jgi:hypothetical protein
MLCSKTFAIAYHYIHEPTVRVEHSKVLHTSRLDLWKVFIKGKNILANLSQAYVMPDLTVVII